MENPFKNSNTADLAASCVFRRTARASTGDGRAARAPPLAMGDFGDDFDMDDLIEEDAGFGAGDADEEDMMKMMEEENFTAAKASTQTTGATGGTGAVPAASSPAAGADDDDLDWLAQAGATQTQGEGTVHRKNGDGDDDDASEDEDEALLFAGYEPPPLASNARADAPVRSALDIEGDAVAVTSADGRRAFVRAEPKGVSAPAFQSGFQSGGTRGAPPSSAASSVKSFLLGESIDSMLDRIEARRRAEALAEAERLKRDAELGREGVRARDKAAEIAKKKRAAADAELCGGKSNGLWVDAHAPRHFTELLSAENVNREVLHWLKAWDGVVFNRAPPSPRATCAFPSGGGVAAAPRAAGASAAGAAEGAAAVAAAAATARLRDWTLIGCRPRTTRTCLWTRTGAPRRRSCSSPARPASARPRWRTSPRGTPGTAWWR